MMQRGIDGLKRIAIAGLVSVWMPALAGCNGGGMPADGDTLLDGDIDAEDVYRLTTESCSRPGAGPDRAGPKWEQGRFPLEPILQLYTEAQCRTFSSSMLRSMVEDLPSFLSLVDGPPLKAGPGRFAAAFEELSSIDGEGLAAYAGTSYGFDPDEFLKGLLLLYIHRDRSPADAEAYETYIDSLQMGDSLVRWLDDYLLSLMQSWGAAGLGGQLDLAEEDVGELLDRYFADLYPRTLGVTREEARLLLRQYGLGQGGGQGPFVSIVHVTQPIEGMRSVYLFAMDGNYVPITGIEPGRFTVLEAGGVVPNDSLVVRLLKDMEDVEGAPPQFSLSLVVDASKSIDPEEAGFIESGLDYFLKTLPPIFRGGLVKFSNEAQVFQTMTGDIMMLRRAVTMPMEPHNTALYDAMGLGLSELAPETTPFHLEIVFTDGRENRSASHCHESVAALSRNTHAPVFVIGMGDIAIHQMMALSNDTRSCFLYAPDITEIELLYQFLAIAIGRTYLVTWPALTAEDSVEVTVRADTDKGVLSDTWKP